MLIHNKLMEFVFQNAVHINTGIIKEFVYAFLDIIKEIIQLVN